VRTLLQNQNLQGLRSPGACAVRSPADQFEFLLVQRPSAYVINFPFAKHLVHFCYVGTMQGRCSMGPASLGAYSLNEGSELLSDN
jgi:hypothetical protein